MEMILKIFNTDVVDCSSSWNEVIPSPESRQLLIDIFLKICESDAVKVITHHSSNLDFQGSLDPHTHRIDLEFESPETFGMPSQQDYFHSISSYIFQIGKVAQEDKIAGLFIEPVSLALQRIENKRRYLGHDIHLLPPGLRGIRRSISIIHAYYSRNYNALPTFCPHKELKNFSLSAGVIWKQWTVYRDDSEHGQVLSGEFDGVMVDSRTMQIHLGSICEGGEQGRENGSKHYPDIQKVLDENWPQMFEVMELNGG